MKGFLAFLYRYRVFFFFVFLELISFWLLVSYNNYYNAFFFNSSNQLAGSIQTTTQNTIDYVDLMKANEELAIENANLRKRIFNLESAIPTHGQYEDQFEVIPAKVVNNNFRRSANYITINKGASHGISPEMGVLSTQGAVGIVKSVSRNYATITSLLHQNLMVSSELKSTGTLCTTQWDAISPRESKVRFIPRHIPLREGDTVVTSGFNAIFPPGVVIGVIESFSLSDESAFYDATLELENDFTSLRYVNVVANKQKTEKDSLEAQYGQN